LHKNKKLSYLIIVMFMFTIVAGFGAPQANAANLKDISGHWAQSQIENLVNKDIIKGYPDNTFRPENSITRAELAVMVNKAFSFTNTTDINFKDVKSTDWFASDIAKAKAAGYISGYPDGTMKPNQKISRQEAAVMIANAAKLDTSAANDLQFKDAATIGAWSRASIAAAVKAGYIKGYPDGKFLPLQSIKRSEAAAIISLAIKPVVTPEPPQPPVKTETYDKAGTFGPATGTETFTGDVTISADGVILQNTTIKGNLLISDKVGQGNVTLKNVTVTETTTIKGGGENSIKLDNCTLGKVIVNKADGKLRIVLSGTKIADFVADSAVKVVGTGTITKATINKNGVTIEPKPGSSTIKSGVTATIAGKTEKGPASSGGGGGSGSGSGTGVTTASAATKADLVNALNDAKIAAITLTANIDMGNDTATINRAIILNGGNKTLTGNVTVNAPGATLSNMTITGDFTAGLGIGNGNLTLNSVIINGATALNGGGSNSIHLAGATRLEGAITLNKEGLRLVVDGNDVRLVGTVTILAPVILDKAPGVDTSDAFRGEIEVPVNFSGTTAIQILATLGVKITIVAGNVKIAVGEGVTLSEIEVNGTGATIDNAGTISTVSGTAPVNVEGNIPTGFPTLSNVTVGGIAPIISGTNFTFGVIGATRYTTGTATLSSNVNYRIQSGTDINVTGNATTSENLVDTAMNVLASAGGTPGDGVLGSVLIARSPVTITLTAGTKQTTYTISFVSAVAPTLSNVTVGGIAPQISGNALTFRVNPATRYSTGTARLSSNVNYRIQSGTIDVTGTATTSENLSTKALSILASQGGTPGDGVLGSTLIAKSPITITISFGAAQTVYTINFVSSVAPTVTNVTIGNDAGSIAPQVSGNTMTFNVYPATRYTTGTATLSTDVSYRIQSGTIDFTGTATTSENLATTALSVLGNKGGTPEDGVLGSTLIARESVTITLTAGGAQTEYTILFKEILPVTPPAPNVTADDTNNVIVGIDATMEYQIDGGAWTAYNATTPPDLSGNKIVKVRVKAAGINPAGAEKTLTFTTNPAALPAYTFGVFNSFKLGSKSVLVKFTGNDNVNDYNVFMKTKDIDNNEKLVELLYDEDLGGFVEDIIEQYATEENLIIQHK
jgi:hypothetical protein